MTATPYPDERRRLLRALHAKARERGLDADARKDLQEATVGVRSAADMTAAQLRRVLAALGRRPGRAQRKADRLPDTPMTAKMRALWISGWHLGAVRDPGDAALAAWVKRVTGLDAAAWCRGAKDGAKAIEGLKDFLAREAGVDWRPYSSAMVAGVVSKIDRPRCRVLEAQWRILHGAGLVKVKSVNAIGGYAERFFRISREISHIHLEPAEADRLIRHFGERIRGARPSKGRTGR